MSRSIPWPLRRTLLKARLLAGVRVEHFAPDLRAITVAFKPRWLRGGRSTPRTGAELYAMVDPLFATMVEHAMGAEYLVWAKAGAIDVLAPGRGRVWTRLELNDEDLRRIRQMTDAGDKHLHHVVADIRDADGMAVARVEQMIYVRRKGRPA